MLSGVPKKLAVIGDSGVFGWGDPEEGGWCERLRRHWMALPGCPVVYNLGVRGDGLERVAARLTTEVGVRGELRRQVPQGILLAVGLNDSARPTRWPPPAGPGGLPVRVATIAQPGPGHGAGVRARAHPGAGRHHALG